MGFSATSIKIIAFFIAIIHVSRPLGKQRIQKVIVFNCDWRISIRVMCFCVSRFVAFELQSSLVFMF